MAKMTLITHSREETLTLGQNLGKSLKSGDIVLLFGDLGAGKTTFTQGICRGSGLPAGEYIRSPTFTLINEYQGHYPIYHIDLYRLETQEDIAGLGLDEVLFANGIAIVEWAEKLFPPDGHEAVDLTGQSRIEIRIAWVSENQRSFAIEPVNMAAREFPVFPLQ